MVATSGEMIFATGGGQKRTVNIYLDDAAGSNLRFDAGGGASATSPTEIRLPFKALLVDMVLLAATGQSKTQITRNYQQTGNTLLNALHLAAIVVRPAPGIAFNPGDVISGIQIA